MIQVQEVSMNISAYKQNIFIKLEQNLSWLYLFNPTKQGNASEEIQINLKAFWQIYVMDNSCQ